LGAAGRTWLGRQILPEALHQVTEQLLRLIDLLTPEVELSETRLQAITPHFPQGALLDSLPGVGAILAAVIWSEVGEVGRFPSAQALVNSTGLVPSLYASGEVSVQGHIPRQGSAWLRWALITAANAACRTPGRLGQRYRRRRYRKPPHVAKTALARSRARLVYGVLKHGCP
jgi:transposase